MFFVIKSLNNFFNVFFKNLVFLKDQLYTLIFFRPIESFTKKWNPKSFTNYFKSQSFSANYIFHWNKLSLVNDKSPHINDLNTNTSYMIHKPRLESFSKKYYTDLLEVLFYSKYFITILNNFFTTCRKTFSFGFYYIRGFSFILFIDACLTDDEPLWEPIEWSLVQTWILFIFAFAWIAENLIVSRYGSYTGRDKRVWIAWYKTFWLIEGYYAINYGITCIFVILPYYFETNYNLSFIYSWWHWYSRVFFYKFIALYTVVLLMGYILQLNIRWLNWKKGLIIILLVNIFIAYLIYTHFFIVFFGYFTDPIWYQKSRSIDYIQLSHEPAKWGWGPAKKDHFTYHNVKTVFWFKNDGPFASAFMFTHLFLFICLFLLFVFWLTLLRRVWSTKELPTTLTTYCVSSLRQFFYFFLLLYLCVVISFLINYARYPWEFFYFLDNSSWINNFFYIILEYPCFLKDMFFN